MNTSVLLSFSSKASTAGVGPETTHSRGALTAAMERGSPTSRASSEAGRETASIAPGGCDCMSRPRSATSASASSSEKTPARCAATYSPMLWPIIASGFTPQLIRSRARAYSTTNSAGWVIAVWRSRSPAASASASPGKSTSRRSKPSGRRRCSQAASTSRRNEGSDS